MTDTITSPRLRELLRMRRFLDDEIRDERQRMGLGRRADLIQAAADLYGTTVDAIYDRDKSKSVASARMMACWLLHESGMSLHEIGQTLDRDHSTVGHACKVIDGDPARKALAMGLLAQEEAA